MTQDRPDAPELLDALAGYLFAEVRDWAPREERFKVLVAANLCAVVARELRAGEAPLGDDLALFDRLLERQPTQSQSGEELRVAAREAQRELADRLRAGELDDRLDEVAAALRDHVRRKLEIGRPGYAEGASNSG